MLTSRLWVSLLHLWDKCVSAADRRSTTKAAIWCRPPLLCAKASWVFSLYRSDVWSIDVFRSPAPANAVFFTPPALSRGDTGRHSSQRLRVIGAVQRLKQVRGMPDVRHFRRGVECTSPNSPAFPGMTRPPLRPPAEIHRDQQRACGVVRFDGVHSWN